MQSHILRSTIFSLIVVLSVGIISGCFGYVYATQHKTSDVAITTVPHVYYSSMKVTKIDQSGNAMGMTSVYRVDGMNGQAQLVSTLPRETYQQQIDFQSQLLQYDVYSYNDMSQSTFPVSIDGAGNTLFTSGNGRKSTWGNSKDEVLTHYQWIHPLGTYATSSDIYCTNTPPEGPCDQSYRFTVTDLTTNEAKTYTAKDFGGLNGQWIVKPLVELSKTTALVDLESIQERLTGYVGIINFSTGKSTALYAMKPDYSGQSHGYEFLRLSDDGQSALFIEWNPVGSEGKTIVSMMLSDGSVKTLVSNIVGNAIVWQKKSPTILFENTDGTKVFRRDIATGHETVVAQTSLDRYLYPVRFTTTTIKSSTGIESGKLLLTDTSTGKQRVIYDQSQNPNAYGGNTNGNSSPLNAKIGDYVYGFIGIDQ